MKMMKVLFVLFVLMSLVTGALWSRSSPLHQEVVVTEGHRVVIEFEEETHGDTKVFISKQESFRTDESESDFSSPGELFDTCKHKIASAFKKKKMVVSEKSSELHDVEEHANEHESGFTGPGELYGTCKHKLASAFKKMKKVACEKTNDFSNLEEHAKDIIDEGVGKFGDPKEFLSQKLSEKVKIVGEKVTEFAESAKSVVGKTIGMVGFTGSTEGTLKDSLVKVEEWDLVDSPKRIGEDIERNASKQIEQGVEEVKETIESLKESSLNELSTKSKDAIHDVFFTLLEKIRSMISWGHLFGFSMAYGMGVWVTFCSSCVLSQCLPKQQFGMVLNKMHMVYFRGMAYCVGAALLGYLVSQGRKGVFSDKMEMFQGFNLASALLMILTNLMFFEPRTTELIVERMKIQMKETDRTKSIAEKLKKLNTYSSTLNVSTMVVLTWHLAYICQLLQARRLLSTHHRSP